MARTKGSKNTTTKKKKVLKEYDGEMAQYLILVETPYTDENGTQSGVLPVGSIHNMPTVLGEALIADGYAELYVEKELETEIAGEGVVKDNGDVEMTITSQVEMYNGKKVVAKGEVEINGVIRKTITTEEGSTYTL